LFAAKTVTIISQFFSQKIVHPAEQV